MKKLLLSTLVGLALLTCQTSFAQKTKGKFSPIKVETPARPANQQDVIQLVTPKLETLFRSCRLYRIGNARSRCS